MAKKQSINVVYCDSVTEKGGRPRGIDVLGASDCFRDFPKGWNRMLTHGGWVKPPAVSDCGWRAKSIAADRSAVISVADAAALHHRALESVARILKNPAVLVWRFELDVLEWISKNPAADYTSADGMIDHQQDNGAADRHHDAIKIQCRDAAEPEEVRQPTADNCSHNPEQNV
jgi:hypothetical protein